MQIIPAINCENFECVKDKLQKIKEIGAEWAHIDIADGIFTRAPEPPIGGSVRGFAPHKTWNNPEDFYDLGLNLEIHLMVENPESAADEWIKFFKQNKNIKGRIIVHLEAIKSLAVKRPDNNNMDVFNFISEKCAIENLEFGLSIGPDMPVEELMPYLDKIDVVQILAVNPGLSGQKFQKQSLDKIKFLEALKENYIDMMIEVDGGIDLETAKICKEAGADILVSASYVWYNKNSKEAFEKLKVI